MFDESLVTVWSAPNYCYRCGNLASIMTVNADGMRAFTVYEAAEENERDKGMAVRKMVSLIFWFLVFFFVIRGIFQTDPFSFQQGTMPYFV
jgi:serine/threonine-protein phosphatase 6 catalytic subunit